MFGITLFSTKTFFLLLRASSSSWSAIKWLIHISYLLQLHIWMPMALNMLGLWGFCSEGHIAIRLEWHFSVYKLFLFTFWSRQQQLECNKVTNTHFIFDTVAHMGAYGAQYAWSFRFLFGRTHCNMFGMTLFSICINFFLFTFRSRQQQLECNQIPQQQQRPPSRPSSRQALLQQELQDQQNFTRSRSLGGYYQQVCWVL